MGVTAWFYLIKCERNGMCQFQAEGVNYLNIFLLLLATVGLYFEGGRAK